MRFTTALFTSVLASTVLATPHVARDVDPDDAILYSPANGTMIRPGQTFNFTYLADGGDTTAVGIAMIQYVPISGAFNTTSTSRGRLVTAEITVPADLTAGTYVIGVQEFSNDDPASNRSKTDYDVDFQDSTGVKMPFYVTVGGNNSTNGTAA